MRFLFFLILLIGFTAAGQLNSIQRFFACKICKNAMRKGGRMARSATLEPKIEEKVFPMCWLFAIGGTKCRYIVRKIVETMMKNAKQTDSRVLCKLSKLCKR
ncbi:unnamed protein product [Calicophoron daubneyi]|uniref:Saposin B-type domain-containing protein n=1 Tax=Calicophoron daubneyi TaxID=300641 RepID=A0AAV2TGB3_CALDB